MEIIFALMLLGATPFGAALLVDKPTRKRAVKFAAAHMMARPQRSKPSMVASIIPTEFGVLEPKSKETEANARLAELWQDAFDWFSIPNAPEVLRKANEIYRLYKDYMKPYEDEVVHLQNRIRDSHGYFYYELLESAQNKLALAREECPHRITSQQKKVRALSEKYGWELVGNDIIRLASKQRIPNMNYLALAKEYKSTVS